MPNKYRRNKPCLHVIKTVLTRILSNFKTAQIRVIFYTFRIVVDTKEGKMEIYNS